MSLSRYIFFWLIPYTVSLAAASTIKGHITDTESGEPLIGANIMLTGTSLGSASDENGAYIIENISIGNYTLKAMFIGYETLDKEIRVEADQEYTTDITLKPSAIELQETKVTAEKRKGKVTGAPASMEIVTSRDIKGKTTTNMGAYLKGLKGIDFTSSGINNYSISVRGFNSSFNTRLLTLSDGRVANIPALRVINYSTIPQSMDDVDKIEVILGPTTALYGANAHSGVVNIISKSPAHSEGLSMSISGSNDERQLRKINGRFAQKLSNNISIKLSGLYLHAYDWPFISKEEYKSHLYPWSNIPYYTADGKDNNPSSTSGNQDNPMGRGLIWTENNSGVLVRIGNGEPDHGCSDFTSLNQKECTDLGHDWEDWDGDGVAGEDWYNGHDDDGDCPGDTNGDGCSCCSGDKGVDEDYFIKNGVDDDGDGYIDENIDEVQEFSYDGLDNDNNGIIDDEVSGGLDDNVQKWGANIENNLLVSYGRRLEYLTNDEPNKYYIQDNPGNNYHVYGNHRYNEQKVILEFDIFNYDFGVDSYPGDPFFDQPGNGIYDKGEKYNGGSQWEDYGVDGLPNTNDFGENDSKWQPGDAWVDGNDDGIVNQIECVGGVTIINFVEFCNLWSTPDSYDNSINETNFQDHDVYPFPNGIWEWGETIVDCGNDGYCWDETWIIGEPHQAINIYGNSITYENGDPVYIYGPDPGEGDGLNPWDYKEQDGIFDTGDGNFGWDAESFIDQNNNGRWDSGELFTDTNGDGRYTPSDHFVDFDIVDDNNGDGLSDYPDFEIDNRKVELRLDFDPHPDFNMTFQTGYSWTKTQQVTGTSRYIADGFEYKFYQLRGRYKNWFSQFYMNQSFSGKTRGYNLGNRIIDKSKNYAFQIQNNFDYRPLNTKFVWGGDYFKTIPNTFGTILNDGPNGYDNDGDDIYIKQDGIDNDGDNEWISNDGLDNDNDGVVDEWDEGIDDNICPDRKPEGFRKGKYWHCTEGIDEPDEFIDPTSNEYGLYYQSTTELFGTSRFELITAARLDYHDLLAEGVQFAPKLGIIYKPDAKSSMRFTYGKAYNTPNSITLFTDLFIGSIDVFNIYLRGNKDGTPYCRVGVPCFGSEVYSVVEPGFYGAPDSIDTNVDGLFDDVEYNTHYKMGTLDDPTYFEGYNDRVEGAPYFYKVHPGSFSLLAGDMVPLDTSVYLIFVPELNGDGVIYTADESMNLPDVDPIKTEKIQTLEFGYKGFFGNKTHFTLDYYFSYYEDFFSPATIITPFVVNRFDSNDNEVTVHNYNVVGLMPINEIGTNPPYGTAWNGIDDDDDWDIWADEAGWRDDKNGDGEAMDPGEWGGVLLKDEDADIVIYEWGDKKYESGDFFHAYEVLNEKNGYPSWKSAFLDTVKGLWNAVGVDELHSTAGLNEYEFVLTGLIDSNGEPDTSAFGNAHNITDVVLSPMNYGNVKMQGCDIGITHFISDKLIVDGNVSWYGTTKFYNELTKKNDPINAPKWKWNASIKWNSDLGDVIVNFRHVDQFKWSDGIWSGDIGPYNIIDLFYTCHITDHLDFNLSALNLNNDRHKELIGGAVMGRQIVMRFTSTF